MVPANYPEEAESILNIFLVSHKVVHIEKEFVTDAEKSFWSICISYLENSDGLPDMAKKRIDYKEVLDEYDFSIFVKLRDLRKELSEKEGIPAYALFTNEQLAHMVQKKVTTQTELGEIRGVGKSRMDKYGGRFLSILRDEFQSGHV